MANMIKKTSYPNNPKQIMLADSQMVSFGVVLSNEGISANAEGRKVVKAGTPLAGNIKARNTAFKKASGEHAVGICLHDVDVTEGNANASLVVFGFVDLEKVESDVVALITEEVETALKAKVTFLTGSGKAV